MPPPAVSILMPVRNEEEFLPAALESVFRQSLTDWELVVVDDSSTDTTPAILAAAAARERRVRVFRSPGRGLAATLNAGLAACRALLVARMDGDDISHPRRLECQLSALAVHPEVGLLACSFRHFPRQGLRVGMLAYEEWQNGLTTHELVLRDLFVESPFVHPSVMFRKEAVMAVGGYRETAWAEDYDLWLRLASAGVRFARLPDLLFFWRDRPGRATRNLPEYTVEAFRACKVHHLQQGFLQGETTVTLAGAGLEGRAWCRTLASVGIRVCRWVDLDPRKVGRTLHGAPVVGPHDGVPDGGKLLVTIGTRGARDQARAWARNLDWQERVDFLCVT